jgi:membrane protein implicated in regulation of membrane protease activity
MSPETLSNPEYVFEILYWHWMILGIVLVLSEIMLTSFFVLWFGAAAIVVGIFLFLFPEISLTYQILFWTILSTALAWGWFKYLKPLSIDKTKAGLASEAMIGEIGQVLSPPNGEKRGTLRFPAPILGNDEWLFISEDVLAIGDRVKVSSISGNSLIVKKHN